MCIFSKQRYEATIYTKLSLSLLSPYQDMEYKYLELDTPIQEKKSSIIDTNTGSGKAGDIGFNLAFDANSTAKVHSALKNTQKIKLWEEKSLSGKGIEIEVSVFAKRR